MSALVVDLLLPLLLLFLFLPISPRTPHTAPASTPPHAMRVPLLSSPLIQTRTSWHPCARIANVAQAAARAPFPRPFRSWRFGRLGAAAEGGTLLPARSPQPKPETESIVRARRRRVPSLHLVPWHSSEDEDITLIGLFEGGGCGTPRLHAEE
ncbi:hypothetical protein B0H11DRAFT_1908601 [Mycena galericulata]|nr:hypothetical protein B0H11DRAFT_1908601 [Mycena galericulata]